MCARPKWRASARAIVPLPLAAGPSPAMTTLRRRLFDALFLAKRRALTGPYRYGKAPRERRRQAAAAIEFELEKPKHGEARMGHQAHLPQVLDPLLRPDQRQSGALHRMRH